GRRIRAGQETERAHVDAEDWLDDIAELPNHMQNCSVASGYDQKIRGRPQFCHRVPHFLASNGCRFFFDQDRNRKTAELLSDDVDQIGNARFAGMRDLSNRFRRHAKNSWLPSAPLIADGTIQVTTWPRRVANVTMLSCALCCNSGSRTIPPFPTSARCNSNCGLISARITPLGVIKSNALGKIKVNEMKETSTTQRSTSSGMCSRERNRAFNFSRTITRGSLRILQANWPC